MLSQDEHEKRSAISGLRKTYDSRPALAIRGRAYTTIGHVFSAIISITCRMAHTSSTLYVAFQTAWHMTMCSSPPALTTRICICAEPERKLERREYPPGPCEADVRALYLHTHTDLPQLSAHTAGGTFYDRSVLYGGYRTRVDHDDIRTKSSAGQTHRSRRLG